MIRNGPQNRSRNAKPYRRVQIPPEVVEQMDRIAMTHISSRVSENPGTTGDRSGQQNEQANASSSGHRQESLWSPVTGNFVGSDSNHTDIEASNDITDDDAIVEAANRIATKPASPASRSSSGPLGGTVAGTSQPGKNAHILPVQLPSSLTSGISSSRYPSVGQPPSTHRQAIALDHQTAVPRKVVVDVDQLRLDLREVFDEFIAQANAVVDRHIERLS